MKYRIALKQRVSDGRPQTWSYYEKNTGIIYESEVLADIELEIRAILNMNPIPIVEVNSV